MDIIERAARAAYEKLRELTDSGAPWEQLCESYRNWRTEAQRAAIEAMREPDETMLKCSEGRDWSDQFAGDTEVERECGLHLWRAMIDAALKD